MPLLSRLPHGCRSSTLLGHERTVNACRAAQGEAALSLAQLLEQGILEYIDFPQALKGKYQNFTQADISNLRAAGYDAPLLTVEQGCGRYVAHLLQSA